MQVFAPVARRVAVGRGELFRRGTESPRNVEAVRGSELTHRTNAISTSQQGDHARRHVHVAESYTATVARPDDLRVRDRIDASSAPLFPCS